MSPPPERVYIVGVCGSAMGGLAGLLAERGAIVGGSDTQFYEPMGGKLAQWGVQTFEGWDAAHVARFAPDRVVVGNVARADNPEVVAARAAGLPLSSFPSFMEETFLAHTDNIVVTGTHGKTTTSSLLSWLFHHAGLDPSFFLGGIPEDLGKGFAVTGGRWFVLEGDEYDTAFFDKGPKFLHYRPRHGLILNVELDHVDIYADYEAVKAAFRRFVALVPAEGSLAFCVEDEGAREVARGAVAALLPYGEGPGSVAVPQEIRYGPDETSFRIDTPDGVRGPFQMRLAGRHNVLNACGAFALWRHLARSSHQTPSADDDLGAPRARARSGRLRRTSSTPPPSSLRASAIHPDLAALATASGAKSGLGLDEAAFSAGLASFSGVRRRLEPKGRVNGARVFEDFGHHPTEIRATLSALRQRHPEATLVAVFRAESNTSRTPLFEPRYVEALGLADRVDLAPTLAKRDYLKTARYFDPALVAAALAEAGTPATAHPDPEALVAALRGAAREGWVITIFSSRGMDGLAGRLTAG